MVILGIDPGPTTCGAVLVDVSARRVMEAWTVEASYGGLNCFLGGWQVGSPVVAIETIEGYAFAAFRTKALIETARVEGIIEALARRAGLVVVRLSAGKWRRQLCGKGNASDDLIETMMPRYFPTTWRVMAAKKHVHWRDAAGVALACGMRLTKGAK